MSYPPYVLITPARNEAEYIHRTIEAVQQQTLRPRRWVIVDDGSTDNTVEIAKRAAADCPWITVVMRADRGFRSVGTGSVAAFSTGLELLSGENYEYLGNLDADIVIGDKYYEKLLDAFKADLKLGIAVGSLYEIHNGLRTKLRCQPEMAAGATKFWRRECFECIGGVVQHSAWDGIDCYKAMMHGWRTATLTDAELAITHLRPLCSSYNSVLQGWVQRGRGMWFLGATPLWVLASCVYHLRSRPYITAAMGMLYGFASAGVVRAPKLADTPVRKFVRDWQYARLKQRLLTKASL